jgi:enoyl-[acyl-carrier protein] reductase II
VICFAPALALAKKLVRSGVDALVIEGMEAGGHIGPVATSVLAQEILPELAGQVPVFVAGGIGRGEAIASYLEMGAAGVQLGTRFACATESIAHPAFKKAFLRANARDAVASVQIDPRLPVIPVRALKNGHRGIHRQAARSGAMLDEGKVDMGEAQLADRALLGRRTAPRGDRRRCRKWFADGGPVGRHGEQGRAGGGHIAERERN